MQRHIRPSIAMEMERVPTHPPKKNKARESEGPQLLPEETGDLKKTDFRRHETERPLPRALRASTHAHRTRDERLGSH